MRAASKRRLAAALVLALGAGPVTGFAAPALAHHGWSWTIGDNIEPTGVLVAGRFVAFAGG